MENPTLMQSARDFKEYGKPKTYFFEGLKMDFQFMENPKPSNTENVGNLSNLIYSIFCLNKSISRVRLD